MDFSKVQQNRTRAVRRQRMMQLAVALFVCMMAAGLLPYLKVREIREKTKVSADAFLMLVQAGKLTEAYSTCVKASLKQTHTLKEFDGILKNLLLRKGKLGNWVLVSFTSRPAGKPYELLEYTLFHDFGLATLTVAMELEDNLYKVRAYRIQALGL
jgi:hypothetical protein